MPQLTANGISLEYDTFGDPGNPALLLVMGLGAQMTMWDPEFCQLLADKGFHVIRFDNRDVGLSQSIDSPSLDVAAVMAGDPSTAPYRLSDMADDAAALLAELGIDKAHVVGASMGGAIAQTLAIEHPSRLRTLTSIMATTGAPGLPPPTADALAVLFKAPAADQAAYFESYAQTWKVLRAGSFPLDEARDLARAGQTWTRGLNPAGSARQLVAILASGSRKEALAAVRVPTLVLHGDADPLVPLACGVDTAESVPGAKLVVIKGMGHALPISMWPQIIDAIAAHAV